MADERDRTVEDWAQPGDPFRLVAVAVESAEWEPRLPPEVREIPARFTDARARARAGASEWLKACWLPRELGLAQVEWIRGANGKPLLAGAGGHWGFNLSHAGPVAVAVLAEGVSVGVDVEATDRAADIRRLAQRVFSESEQEQVKEGGREAFFRLWSQKEALLKALGCGWADGNIQRRTRLACASYQREPATGARIWCRPVLGGSHVLAVAMI